MTRIQIGALCLGLAACTGKGTGEDGDPSGTGNFGDTEDTGDPTGCTEDFGTVHGGIVDYDGNPHEGLTFVEIHPEGSASFTLPPTAEGAYEVDLSPGRYRISAESDWGCFADPEPELDVVACERHAADLSMDLCVGR